MDGKVNKTMTEPKRPGEHVKPADASASFARFVPLAVFALCLTAFFAFGAQGYFTLESLLRQRQSLMEAVTNHGPATAAFYFGLYLLVAALSVPGASLLTLAGGFLFGALYGAVLAVLAATCGAALLFFVARTSLGALLAQRAGPFLIKFESGFRKNEASYLLFLRLVPAFPFWLVNLASALLGARFSTFVWTTFAGIVPATAAFAIAGAELDTLLKMQIRIFDECVAAGVSPCKLHFSASTIMTPGVLLALLLLGCAALIPVAIKTYRERAHG